MKNVFTVRPGVHTENVILEISLSFIQEMSPILYSVGVMG